MAIRTRDQTDGTVPNNQTTTALPHTVEYSTDSLNSNTLLINVHLAAKQLEKKESKKERKKKEAAQFNKLKEANASDFLFMAAASIDGPLCRT